MCESQECNAKQCCGQPRNSLVFEIFVVVGVLLVLTTSVAIYIRVSHLSDLQVESLFATVNSNRECSQSESADARGIPTTYLSEVAEIVASAEADAGADPSATAIRKAIERRLANR